MTCTENLHKITAKPGRKYPICVSFRFCQSDFQGIPRGSTPTIIYCYIFFPVALTAIKYGNFARATWYTCRAKVHARECCNFIGHILFIFDSLLGNMMTWGVRGRSTLALAEGVLPVPRGLVSAGNRFMMTS